MGKILRCALLFCLTILICTACEKEDSNELLQTEHVPGKEEAVVYSPTPVPSSTKVITPTATQAPTPTTQVEVEVVTPLPTLPAEEPEFMNMYRAMPAGTRVDTEGISKEEVRFCFCKTEITEQIRNVISGQKGSEWKTAQTLDGIRVLYYRSDGRLYICDVVAGVAESDTILNCFYLLYQKGQQIENPNSSLPVELSGQGYRANMFFVGNAQYVYIYK